MTGPDDENTDGQRVRPRRPKSAEHLPKIRSGAVSSPDHYGVTVRYAKEADAALKADDTARAQALAAIGQIHAMLSASGRSAFPPGEARQSSGRPGAGDRSDPGHR